MSVPPPSPALPVRAEGVAVLGPECGSELIEGGGREQRVDGQVTHEAQHVTHHLPTHHQDTRHVMTHSSRPSSDGQVLIDLMDLHCIAGAVWRAR